MVSTNTATSNLDLEQALAGIPKKFRDRLIETYLDLKRNFAESRDDAAGLSAGKFCEVGLRTLQHCVFGTSTPFGTKLPNFAAECQRIIAAPAGSVNELQKLIIPRALAFLYTMRSKRGIGHIGGDVDANRIDTAVMSQIADWIICELIRIHHGFSLEEAQDLVDALAIRQLPQVWEVAGKKRVLQQGLTARDQSLLLLYSSKEANVLIEDLVSWVEYSNPAVFKSKVLHPLHKDRMVEWDSDADTIILSPKGAKYVEDSLLRRL
jgi:hypothetical protein